MTYLIFTFVLAPSSLFLFQKIKKKKCCDQNDCINIIDFWVNTCLSYVILLVFGLTLVKKYV